MNESLPITRSEFKVRAMLLGERLDPRGWELDPIATSPLSIGSPGRGVIIVFRYGAVVFFDVPPEDELTFLLAIERRLIGRYRMPEIESLDIRVVPKAREEAIAGCITLGAVTIERLQLTADALSKSVVLALYETRLASTFDGIEPLAKQLEETGRVGATERELLRHIGATLRINHMMVGRVAVSEKPELLWDHPELEGLFNRLEDEFEIRERHAALERKLSVISRTTQAMLELLTPA